MRKNRSHAHLNDAKDNTQPEDEEIELVAHHCPRCGRTHYEVAKTPVRCKCGLRLVICGTCFCGFWTQKKRPVCPICTVERMEELRILSRSRQRPRLKRPTLGQEVEAKPTT